jgi:ADP-ribose pyrophosphatase
MKNPIRVKNIREIDQLTYLKSYAIDYYDKNSNERVWELVSRQGLERLKNEVYNHKSYSDGVMIFATNALKTKVVLLKEYRVSAGKFVYTIPAGLVDSKETIEDSAIREFKEETGLSFEVKQIDQERYTSVGIINEKVNIAYGYYSGTPTQKFQEASEYAEIEILNKKEVEKILINEEVTVRTALLLKSFFNLNSFFSEDR